MLFKPIYWPQTQIGLLLMVKFITREGLKQLDMYKYKGGKWSWLDLKINPFWEFLTTLLPPKIAPNLVTFIGWLFVILSYSVMLIYDYTFKKDIPRWTFFFAAFCIFVYINLDAIDGKQARRTGASSPLGQLFDHGCDSFSLTFFILAACEAAQLEKDEVFLLFVAGQVAFWTSNWMEYHTGVLQTSVGNFGVTESQLICIVVHILTGVFGQKFWNINLDFILPSYLTANLYSAYPIMKYILSIKVKLTVSYTIALTLMILSLYSFAKTLVRSQKNKLKMLAEWSSIFLIAVMEYIWFNLSIYDRYNGIILVNFGILSSLLICKVIISSVTKMKLQYFHKEIIVFLVATGLMIRLDHVFDHRGMRTVFWGCFLINVITIVGFLYSVIEQITSYLGIQCFSIKKVLRKMD